MRGILRLALSDFWPGQKVTDTFLWRTLERRFQVERDEAAPLLAYSVFGTEHRTKRATKVLITGEPWGLRPREFDYSIGWQLRDHDRHLRVPLAIWGLLQSPDLAHANGPRDWAAWAERPLFCNFVYSNPRPQERRVFLAELGRRRFVHSPGAVDTNSPPIEGDRTADNWSDPKLDYLRQFRFTIAFENRALPGYTSEKLVDALRAGTIPIYWGNPDVELDVDPSSFIDVRDFGSFAEAAEYVVDLDDHRERALPLMASEQPLRHDIEAVTDSIAHIFERARDDMKVSTRMRRATRPLRLGLRSKLRGPARRVRKLARRVD